jgi:hypothetical protein
MDVPDTMQAGINCTMPPRWGWTAWLEEAHFVGEVSGCTCKPRFTMFSWMCVQHSSSNLHQPARRSSTARHLTRLPAGQQISNIQRCPCSASATGAAHPTNSRPRSSELGTQHSTLSQQHAADMLACCIVSGPLP